VLTDAARSTQGFGKGQLTDHFNVPTETLIPLVYAVFSEPASQPARELLHKQTNPTHDAHCHDELPCADLFAVLIWLGHYGIHSTALTVGCW
jgi:hypothetical protein